MNLFLNPVNHMSWGWAPFGGIFFIQAKEELKKYQIFWATYWCLPLLDSNFPGHHGVIQTRGSGRKGGSYPVHSTSKPKWICCTDVTDRKVISFFVLICKAVIKINTAYYKEPKICIWAATEVRVIVESSLIKESLIVSLEIFFYWADECSCDLLRLLTS